MASKVTHEIVPDVTLFEKLGARSRAFPMVVTELVDNSLDSWIALQDSRKRDKQLTVEITASEAKDAWFVIKDNAGGMTRGELINAMKVAKSDKKKGSLGYYGFGLKSAAMYIGGQFRIYTRSHKEPKVIHYVEFDKDKFRTLGEWELEFQTLGVDDVAKVGIHFPDGHGTEIRIRNDRYRSANKKGILRRLQHTFAPRLVKNPRLKVPAHDKNADQMRLLFNDETVTARGPFYEVWENSASSVEEATKDFLKRVKQNRKAISDVTTDYIKGKQPEAAVIPFDVRWFEKIPSIVEIPEKIINGKRVSGRMGILDRGMAHNNEYGFDLIKHGRVIEANVLDKEKKKTVGEDEDEKKIEKSRDIGLNASNHNARIVGQLFLDDWEADHQKTSFIKDSDDWAELTRYVATHSKKLLSISHLLQNPKKYFEKEGIIDENAPEIIADKKFEDRLPSITKGIQKAIRASSLRETITSLEKRHTESPKKPIPKEKVESATNLSATKLDINFTRKGESADMVVTKVRKDGSGNLLQVTLNRDHPFLTQRESAELTAIGEFIAIDYFASYVVTNRTTLTHEDFLKIRDKLLRELPLKK